MNAAGRGQQLQRFRRLCSLNVRRVILPEEDDRVMLKKLGLLDQRQLTRAAVLLFAKEPQRFCPSAFVKVGRFLSPTVIVDDREVYGTLFDQVEGVLAYFREHLETRFGFTGQLGRKVVWEYPLEAWREAIVNAVCHRDTNRSSIPLGRERGRPQGQE